MNCEISDGLVRFPVEKRGRITMGIGVRMASVQHQYPYRVHIAVHRPNSNAHDEGRLGGPIPSGQRLPVLGYGTVGGIPSASRTGARPHGPGAPTSREIVAPSSQSESCHSNLGGCFPENTSTTNRWMQRMPALWQRFALETPLPITCPPHRASVALPIWRSFDYGVPIQRNRGVGQHPHGAAECCDCQQILLPREVAAATASFQILPRAYNDPGTPTHRGLSFAYFWSRERRELIERATDRRT